MTEQRSDSKHENLAALYRQAGDVEPEAGLDRIIRARADEAARTGRSLNRFPWLGGLATASVAIIAVAVVLQQTPPRPQSPESFAPQASPTSDRDAPEAFMAPSIGADSTLESSAETQRARERMHEMAPGRAEAPEASAPPSAATLRAPALLSSERLESGQQRSEKRRAALLSDIVIEQAANVAEPPAPELEESVEDPDTMLARIKALLEEGEIQRTRELLRAFRQEYPERSVPEDIETALKKASEDSGR